MVAMKRLAAVLVVFLGACTVAPQRSLPPVVEGSGPAADVPAAPVPERRETPRAPSTGGAVVALLDRADRYRSAGDTAGEAATIERALRIDPRNARLWNRLAATRLEQGQPQQAEQLALKSNALAAGDSALQARNWRLVAKARWTMNDGAGARSAEQKAHALGGF
jgi:predicted Zn-dependent protease